MSDKKRKHAAKDSNRPNKKQQTVSTVQVNHISGPDIAKPVIAISPGVDFPNVNFQSFARSSGTKPNILLHSSEHDTLNYTARENDISTENHLKHYVAVFDPDTGKLEVTEAKKLIVRSAIRAGVSTREEDDEDEIAPVTNYTSRAALTAAFGTKKSKKAVQSMAENRLLAQGIEDADNPISNAMLANVKDEDDAGQEISLADALSNKPLPPANLGTNEIDQVYSLKTLVQPGPAENTLKLMPINTWIARISEQKEVMTRSRFVANRVAYLTTRFLNTEDGNDPKLTKALQVLRYIQVLLDLQKYISRLQKRKPFLPTDKWPEKTMSDGTPMSIIRPIMSYFFPERLPKDHAVTRLQTTILALTLHIPPPSGITGSGVLVTEPTDIALDMAIDAAEIKRLYRELGCKVVPASDTELQTWGLEKLKSRKDEDGNSIPKPNFAKLKFPLDFPKLSRGPRAGRR